MTVRRSCSVRATCACGSEAGPRPRLAASDDDGRSSIRLETSEAARISFSPIRTMSSTRRLNSGVPGSWPARLATNSRAFASSCARFSGDSASIRAAWSPGISATGAGGVSVIPSAASGAGGVAGVPVSGVAG